MTNLSIRLDNNKTITVSSEDTEKLAEYLPKSSLCECANCGGILEVSNGIYYLNHYSGCKYLPARSTFTKTIYNGVNLDLKAITSNDKTYKTAKVNEEDISDQTTLDLNINKLAIIDRCIHSKTKTIRTALSLFKEFKNNLHSQKINGKSKLSDIVATDSDYLNIYKNRAIDNPKLVICKRLSPIFVKDKFDVPEGYCLFKDYYIDDLDKCVYFIVRHPDRIKNHEFIDFIKNRPESYKQYSNVVLFSNDWQIVENDKYVIFKSDIHWDSFAFVNASSLR